MDEGENKYEHKPKFSGNGMSKNSRIKASLFRDKRKGGGGRKGKPKKIEDEGQEVKRLKNLIEKNQMPEPSSLKRFQDLPISRKTVWGLKESGYAKPTEVQRESIGLALRGLDILGAAKTGSGKTLAFVIPVLEKLYTSLWSETDGLGAIIITPTRELAYQIFETLRNVGRKHDFSAGLIIGGKDLKFERKRVDQLNIIICTPGRLLQHMDENPNFDCSNVEILVLDEADRCLDLGFEQDMNAIIENLPAKRQTLLFSATQTKSVKDLARLSLRSPVYISVHENAEHATPTALQQSYVVCPLDVKLDMIWSFIKHHKKKKVLVFLSSCKQVRFVHLLFCRMRPGTSVLALYGSLHQLKRMSVYDEFSKKQAAVLFATDIAARGLDFPGVDWVVQLDCPEDSTTYIHRAGRTARYNKGGESLLVVLPSEEEAMVDSLTRKKIPIQKIEVNQTKFVSVRRKFESLLARDINLKECAQRAFKSYLKAVWLMKDKAVFDVTALDLDAFASSLGLAVAPRVRFLQRKAVLENPKKKKGQQNDNQDDDDDDIKLEPKSESDVDVSDMEEEEKKEKVKKVKPEEKKNVAKNETGFKSSGAKTLDFSLPDEDSDDDAEALFKSKKPAELGDDEDNADFELLQTNSNSSKSAKKPKSKAALAKKLLKKKIQTNKKLTFDDVTGDAVPDIRRERQSATAKSYDAEQDVGGIDIERVKEIMKEEDFYDKQIFRERIRAKHREERLKKRLARKGLKKDDDAEGDDGNEMGVQLGNSDNEESDDDGPGPNLGWLPDPDQIYGEREQDEDEDSHFEPDDEDDDDDDDEDAYRRKRPLQVVNSDSDSDDQEEIPPEFSQKINNSKLKNSNVSVGGSKSKRKKLMEKAGSTLDKGLMEEWALKLLTN
ncbi:probable ATP-dependent RNA helicase DDX10 isoform X2 [Folsomia candida]|uniref:ATP-dependent RNA helicase n=2 Tax=Folsomia candida TaxID=158441 RepID=A0A226E0Z1_FOLCA|nr:probable ATP-dependent RNA helicase DDX10 isoform X2 [Folsomia candida]OXA50694.1 putative ATP-dependent RNA helicase DDX10 [Folsomia candida]